MERKVNSLGQISTCPRFKNQTVTRCNRCLKFRGVYLTDDVSYFPGKIECKAQVKIPFEKSGLQER